MDEKQQSCLDRHLLKLQDYNMTCNNPWTHESNSEQSANEIKRILDDTQRDIADAADDFDFAATLFHADYTQRLEGPWRSKMKEEYLDLNNMKQVFQHNGNSELRHIVKYTFENVYDFYLSGIGCLRGWIPL